MEVADFARTLLLAVWCGVLAVFQSGISTASELETRDFAARTELIPINTLTLSDSQFFSGDEANAKPTTLGGELRIAQGAGRLPLVMLQHGSGGMGANVEMWSREFNRMGVSTFILDDFTGRGLTEVSTDQALLGRLNFILEHLSGARCLSEASARRFTKDRPHGVFPWWSGCIVCQPETIS